MTQIIASKGGAAAANRGEARPPIVGLGDADAGGPVFAGTDVPSVRYGRYGAAAYAEAGYAGQEARVNGGCVGGGD